MQDRTENSAKITLEVIETDDPRAVERQAREEYALHVVPRSARLGRREVFGSWSSIMSSMALLYYGALSAVLVGVEQALIGITLVTITFSVLGPVFFRKGLRSGLNSTLLTREVFGVKGAALGPLLIAAGGTYYALFETSVLAAALHAYFGWWDINIWYLVVMAGMLPLMLGGMQTWLGKLNGISLPIYVVGVVAAVVVAGAKAGWDVNGAAFVGIDHGKVPGWLTIFILYMGLVVLLAETVDVGRFAREEDHRFHAHVTVGWVFYGVTYLFSGAAGILLVAMAPHGAGGTEVGIAQLITSALGIVGLIVVIVTQVRINSANFYFASIHAERFVAHFSPKNFGRKTWVVVIGMIVLALCYTDVFSYIAVALSAQGVLLVSWVAMLVVDWLFDKDRAAEFRPRRLTTVAPGFWVWILTSVVGIYFLRTPGQFPTLSALAPLISFVLAVIVYGAVRAAGVTGRLALPEGDIRERIDDPWEDRVRCANCDLHYLGAEFDTDVSQTRVLCLECQA